MRALNRFLNLQAQKTLGETWFRWRKCSFVRVWISFSCCAFPKHRAELADTLTQAFVKVFYFFKDKVRPCLLIYYVFFFWDYIWSSTVESLLTFNRKDQVLVAQSCPTLFHPMDCSLPGSSVHGILQAGILEWVAMPSSRRSSQPRDWI